MESPEPWYAGHWDTPQNRSPWASDTVNEVNFLIWALGLQPSDRILDLACGSGRHVVELTARGYDVVGVDISPELVGHANWDLERIGYPPSVVCSDIREINYSEEFDVVLSMKDGAIGYLENESENARIFERVSAALKPGAGRHFLEVLNAFFFAREQPVKLWETDGHSVSLSEFVWDSGTRRVQHQGCRLPIGKPLHPLDFGERIADYRLYNYEEISCLLSQNGLSPFASYGSYSARTLGNDRERELIVCSRKVR